VTVGDRSRLLGDLFLDICATVRPVHTREPPPGSNDAYIELLFAYGYRRLGLAERAHELELSGRARLAAHLDPVHAWLIDALISRATGELPASLRERLEALDRVSRYKVDRFREASQIVGGGELIDAIRRFSGGRASNLVADTAATLDMIDHAFEHSHSDQNLELAELITAETLHVEPEAVDPAKATQILDRVIPRLAQMTDRRTVIARLIAIAAHAAPVRVAALTERLAPLLTDDWRLETVLTTLSQALAAGHQDELRALWSCVPESARSMAAYRFGELRLGAAVERRDLIRPFTNEQCARELRNLAIDTFLSRPVTERFAGGWVGQAVANAADKFGTNSHFSFAVIEVVDRVVRGVLAP